MSDLEIWKVLTSEVYTAGSSNSSIHPIINFGMIAALAVITSKTKIVRGHSQTAREN